MARRQLKLVEAKSTFFLPVALEVATDACIEEVQFMGGMLGRVLDEWDEVRPDVLSGEIRWERSRLSLGILLESTKGGTAIRFVVTGEDADLRDVLETMQEHLEAELKVARHDPWSSRLDPLPGRPHHEPHIPALAPRALKLFISYRRSESLDVAGRINDRLSAYFGQEAVFKDVDSIPPGRDFRKQIAEAVEQCNVLIAIIGPAWLMTPAEQGNRRRLAQRNDFVRIEIESALRRTIPVVPVLIHEAAMPTAVELPAALRALAYRQASEVRSDPDFHTDMDRLILKLRTDLLTERTTT